MKKIKGCYNENCISFKKRIKYNDTYDYCPKCGSELFYVCNDKHCYNKLDEVLKGFCDECIVERKDKSDKRKEKTAELIKCVPAAIGAIGGTIPAVLTLADKIQKKK